MEDRYKPLADGPQDVIDANYCGQLQQLMVQTSLAVINDSHQSYGSFIKSKPAIEPLTSHQYVNYLPLIVGGEAQDFPAIVSCKLKTADLIKDTYGEDKAKEEGSCQQFVERDLVSVIFGLQGQTLAFNPSTIVVDEDEMSSIGPSWLKPWPYQTAYAGAKGNLHLRSKALLVPFSVFIPMPDRFKGTHYCHLPTKQYLRAVLLGDISVSALNME
jgi:hypothetical protein